MENRQYYYIFEDRINVETINNLIGAIDDKEKVHLFVSTEGGETFPMHILLQYLNSRKDDIEITCTNIIMSAGVLLLTDFKGKINLSEELECILVHKFDCEGYRLREGWLDEKEKTKQLVADNKRLKEKLKNLGLNKKQLKKFEQGKDVILYQKDFKQLNINK